MKSNSSQVFIGWVISRPTWMNNFYFSFIILPYLVAFWKFTLASWGAAGQHQWRSLHPNKTPCQFLQSLPVQLHIMQNQISFQEMLLADGSVLITHSTKDMQLLINWFVSAASKFSLKINIKKQGLYQFVTFAFTIRSCKYPDWRQAAHSLYRFQIPG